ncbi:Geraniol 8-hydroxylase [Capsicum annuum]|uniref:Geraniol 8-hydroxylase n=1 Tax=Capsicum annuum TaxID=4072 RepID=A0A2G3A5M7_CAPAN|nr:Geraniol 8-hydroxylase [Capsicum annuum]
MDYVNICLGLLFVWLMVHGLISLRRTKRLAPGPFPLPIIGNLHLLGDKPHKSLAQVAKTHGPIMNLKLGQVNTVVISSSVLAKEVLQKQDLTFSNRFVPDAARACNHSYFSAVRLPVDSQWRTLHKIMNSHIFSGKDYKLELFTAGTDTASNTLEWVMAELLKNPHTLEKAQEELAQVVGRGKLVDGADVAKLPYLKCIIKETFRLHPQVPFLIPCKVEEDVDFSGYFIPKDSQVLVNSWAIGRDSSLWEDPLDFTRERICPVLPLAIWTVPVALSSLLNAFNWKLHGGIVPKDLDMEEDFGITLAKTQPLLAIPIPL